ncbi:MFS transporter [Clostridium fallax]|uniref:Major Facilitator Superfamily protein n=1 Tax=Clostridium fallax TaxID=1533 RepID=A0A1M4U6I1_9CLOT|nr:MFS transporter [Clostridium fallax]SHE52362.1 Major Facilitator Superfamily protein [Clostridium fallax]SQB06105.1 major facilitator family transporter [Clostridium fallax]
MNENLVEGINPDQKRWTRNCYVFILSYIFMGAVTGITNDAYITFLQLSSPDVVKALPVYTGISTLAMAAILLLANKVGYKKLIIPAPIILVLSLIMTIYSDNPTLLLVGCILINIGAGLYDYIYPLIITSYTTRERRTLIFSRTLYCNIISQSILTFFDGKMVVYNFAQRMGISYGEASTLTRHSDELTQVQFTNYMASYRAVLWVACAFTVISCICLFFLKEKPEDYRTIKKEIKVESTKKKSFDWSIFRNKYIIFWLVFMLLIRFGASLIVQYFPVYLNEFLHINRGTTSTILTLQSVAMVLFIMLTPYIEKKFGAIIGLGGFTILSIPLMFIMANGAMLGSNVAWIVGIVLFFRSGLANACNPISSSLPLTFVSKDERPAYNSVIILVSAIGTILAGFFCRFFLLTSPSGYANAYYYTSALYGLASVILILVFYKKYNRVNVDEENDTKLEEEEQLEK